MRLVQIKLELNQPLGIGEAFGVLRLWRSFGSLSHYPRPSMKLVTHKATSSGGLIQFSSQATPERGTTKATPEP
jgi:hypothetical protein